MGALPFADRSFDCVVSVTALCFVDNEGKALRKIIRVARRRFALGLLNRDKRRISGSYAGARWHGHHAVTEMLRDLPLRDVHVNCCQSDERYRHTTGPSRWRPPRESESLPRVSTAEVSAFLYTSRALCTASRPSLKPDVILATGR